MIYKLEMPMYAYYREDAHALYDAAGVPDRLDGDVVVLLCGQVRYVAESFADGAVEVALDRGAAEVALVGCGEPFLSYALDAEWRRGKSGIVARRRAVEVGV